MRYKRLDTYNDTDIDIEKILSFDTAIGDYFYLQDLKQRKMFLNSYIEQSSVEDIVRNILQFNKEDKHVPVEERAPILLYISSNGGEVDPGFELIDVIMSSKTPVYTINLGYWYSMGFLIGISGHRRYASKNAKFLMHDGSQFVFNSTNKVQDQMQFQSRLEDRVMQHVLTKSKLSEEEYDSKRRVEWYMFVEDAKEKGFVDFIIGEDCDIDDVI